jgi:hypothetical protein
MQTQIRGNNMNFDEQEKQLVITLDHPNEKKFLQQILEKGGLESNQSRFDFFDPFLCNTEWDWIRPEEIQALTDAPILGRRASDDSVVEAYGFMDYCVTSMLKELYDFGKVTLTKG